MQARWIGDTQKYLYSSKKEMNSLKIRIENIIEIANPLPFDPKREKNNLESARTRTNETKYRLQAAMPIPIAESVTKYHISFMTFPE